MVANSNLLCISNRQTTSDLNAVQHKQETLAGSPNILYVALGSRAHHVFIMTGKLFGRNSFVDSGSSCPLTCKTMMMASRNWIIKTFAAGKRTRIIRTYIGCTFYLGALNDYSQICKPSKYYFSFQMVKASNLICASDSSCAWQNFGVFKLRELKTLHC